MQKINKYIFSSVFILLGMISLNSKLLWGQGQIFDHSVEVNNSTVNFPVNEKTVELPVVSGLLEVIQVPNTPVVRGVWFGMSISEVVQAEGRQPLLAKVIQNGLNQEAIIYQEDIFEVTLLLYYLFVDNRLSNIVYYCIANCGRNNFLNVVERMAEKYGVPNLLRDDANLQYSWKKNKNRENYLITTSFRNQNAVSLDERSSFTIGYIQSENTIEIFLPNLIKLIKKTNF